MKRGITLLCARLFGMMIILNIIACKDKQDYRTYHLDDGLTSGKSNPLGNYDVNPFSGDSVFPLILSNGDTLHTGVALDIPGRLVDPVTLPSPIVKSLPGKISMKPAFPNRVRAEYATVAYDRELIKQKALGDGDNRYYLQYLGDTIITGTPLVIDGARLPYISTLPTAAKPPAIKDAAIGDLRVYDMDQGLESSMIMSMCEDRSGNIWFGTQGSGVCKFDGENFYHFKETFGMIDGRVWAILEDRNGDLWFGTDGDGVIRFNGSEIIKYHPSNGFAHNMVRTIVEDSEGNIWFGTRGGGVSKYDGQTFTHYTEREGLHDRVILSIHEDKLGRMWFGGMSNGVCSFDGERFTYYNRTNGLCGNNVWSIFEDDKDNLWFCTNDNGLCSFDGQSFNHYNSANGLQSNVFFDGVCDPHGNIWFGSYGGGVIKYDGQYFHQYSADQGMGGDIIWCMMRDSKGALWASNIGNGVTRFDPGGFRHFREQEGLPVNIVFDLLEDKNGHIWMATDNGGVCRFDGENFTYYTTGEGLSWDVVTSIEEDLEGNLWFGTYDEGVNKFDGKSFTLYTTENGLSSNLISTIFADSKGSIWIGTEFDGLTRFDGKLFTIWNEQEGLYNAAFNKICEDRAGNLWFATSIGLTKYDGTQFFHYSEKEGLPYNGVTDIEEDSEGNFWLSFYKGGIAKFDGRQFTNFTEEDGLSNNEAWSVELDNKGNIWSGTEGGLSSLHVDSSGGGNKIQYKVFSYNKSDALLSLSYFSAGDLLDKENRLWHGGLKHMEMLDLNQYSYPNKMISPKISRIEIGGQFLDFRAIPDSILNNYTFDEVVPFENYPTGLEVSHHQNYFTFYFVATDIGHQHNIKYRYRIAGIDDLWSQPSSEIKAEYRNLAAGKHTFEVMSMGVGGGWSQPIRYDFTVLPPWWSTWWARIVYLIILSLGIYGIVRWRTASLQARAENLQIEVDKATVVIRKQKDEVEKEKHRSEKLLLNILPVEVAEELKDHGKAQARHFDEVTVLFSDFKGFTKISETLSPVELVAEIDICFRAFDEIMGRFNIEKIKTIGDAYMCAGGLPVENKTHAIDMVKAALEMQRFMLSHGDEKRAQGKPVFEARIGIHTGPVVAGIVGVIKFQYDIWGDTVNIAARLESNSDVGKINVSKRTYELIKDQFPCEHRGKILAKNKGEIDMYYVKTT